MKKLLAVMLMVLFLAGCGAAAKESGYYEHNSMYRDWEHMKFSLWGYKAPDPKAAELTKEESWWGTTVVEPGK